MTKEAMVVQVLLLCPPFGECTWQGYAGTVDMEKRDAP